MPRENVVYGFHSAEEIIRNQPDHINHIWTARGRRTFRLSKLLELAHQKQIPIQVVEDQALARLAGSNRHQNIVVETSPYRYFDADSLIADVHSSSLFCILDEIQDSTNLGNLIRTMEGAGVAGIFLPERRSAAITAVTHRISAGAMEHVKIARVVNLANLMERLKDKGIRFICADPGGSRLWFEADYLGPLAIVVGNERKGVRRLLQQKSDEIVRIPMLGKVESLNVNVAAAILLYEAVRQRESLVGRRD